MIKTKISLMDADEKEFSNYIKNIKNELESINGEINKIYKVFDKLSAQERYLFTDTLIGQILNASRLSGSIMSSVLFKYLLLSARSIILPIESEKKIKASYLSYLG